MRRDVVALSGDALVRVADAIGEVLGSLASADLWWYVDRRRCSFSRGSDGSTSQRQRAWRHGMFATASGRPFVPPWSQVHDARRPARGTDSEPVCRSRRRPTRRDQLAVLASVRPLYAELSPPVEPPLLRADRDQRIPAALLSAVGLTIRTLDRSVRRDFGQPAQPKLMRWRPPRGAFGRQMTNSRSICQR